MEQSHSWEANRFSVSQEIPRIVWNPKVHQHVHKCVPPVTILSQLDPLHTLIPHPTSWRPSLIISSHLRLRLPSGLLPSGLPTKTLYTPQLSPIHTTCAAHFILLKFIIWKSLDDQYRSLSSSICSFLLSPVTSSLPQPQYSPQHVILKHLQSTFLSQMWATKFHARTSQQAKILFCIWFHYLENLIFKFLDCTLEDKIFCTCPDFSLLLISSRIQFWFVKVVPKYLNTFKATITNLCTATSSYIMILRHDQVLRFISTYIQSNLPSSSY